MKELCDYIKPEDELRTIFPYFASNYSKLVTSIPFLLLSLNDNATKSANWLKRSYWNASQSRNEPDASNLLQ
uniref:Uncharacterized protein n=1 Tax=Ditylenchus dipsaci TaxID=166011 RepID=A0A915D338_9BILA